MWKSLPWSFFAVLLLLLTFFLGYLAGRSAVNPVYVTVDAPAPAPMAVVQTEQTFPIDLNTADADCLEELPGIGPSLAQAIVAYRQEVGPFVDKTQLMDVSGIGPAKYADLEQLITVEGEQ